MDPGVFPLLFLRITESHKVRAGQSGPGMDPERVRARCVGSRWVRAEAQRPIWLPRTIAYPRPLPDLSLFHLVVLGIAGADLVRPEAAAGGARGSR